MTSRNAVKLYKPNSFYHIYNRGVEKRTLYLDEKDYQKFTRYLRDSLAKSQMDLVSYCLMPNHFHLLAFQRNKNSIEDLMRSLGTKYVTYFNHKYDRVGHLFQGTYRARLIKNPEDLINTSAYIHNNPRKGGSRINPKNYEYSSLSSYAHKSEHELISKTYISEIMKIEDYMRFIDEKLKERIDLG